MLPKRPVGRRYKKIKPVLNPPKRPVGRPKKIKTDKELEAELSSRADCLAESKRRGKYSVFTPTLKEDILKEVEQNGLGVTARKYEIAKSTISTWKKDYNVNAPRTEKGRKIGSGRIPVHNNSVEEKVLAWISQQQEHHIQLTQESIQEYARSLKQDDRPSIMGTAAWFRRFIDRNNISV